MLRKTLLSINPVAQQNAFNQNCIQVALKYERMHQHFFESNASLCNDDWQLINSLLPNRFRFESAVWNCFRARLDPTSVSHQLTTSVFAFQAAKHVCREEKRQCKNNDRTVEFSRRSEGYREGEFDKQPLRRKARVE